MQMDDLCSSLADLSTTGPDIQHAGTGYVSCNVQLFIIVEAIRLCACSQKCSGFLFFICRI